ncbi:hypothetical protein GX50_04986 [[Emmonsia] crescens]|uniref:Uncharacterized protein n=1 Tax=[Emmonsia] crescens TaxID=73230 RepID=A0A2B7ZF87_9EURO|nr:hypothetical protein GX50_04986 [Emmonsia crescens]
MFHRGLPQDQGAGTIAIIVSYMYTYSRFNPQRQWREEERTPGSTRGVTKVRIMTEDLVRFATWSTHKTRPLGH